MISNRKIKHQVYLAFKDKSVIFTENDGSFVIELSNAVSELDVSLVLDIYYLYNQNAHPEGHFGWQQFSIDPDARVLKGKVHWNNNHAKVDLAHQQSTQSWLNPEAIPAKQLLLIAVLRENTTNAIVYLEKIPVFQTSDDCAAFYHAPVSKNGPLAKAWFFPDTEGVVRLVCRDTCLKDAVGHFCLDIYRLCRENNIPVVLYAEFFDLCLNQIIERESKILADAGEKDTIFYFHSTYDPLLEEIIQLNVKKKMVYFHGITNPTYFRVFDFELSAVCEKAYQQLPLLARFDVIASNSKATADLLAKNVSVIQKEAIKIIPPKLMKKDLTKKSFAKKTKQKGAKLLYVGRIKSHKKIEDLVQLFANYLTHDQEAELFVVGGQGEKAYTDYLTWSLNHYLGSTQHKVKWFGQVSDEELKNIYQTADAYISMSEDEGFCLPLLEAMIAGVPVFAYGISAAKEVLYEAGICFNNKNFPALAQYIHTILSDDSRIKDIISKQWERANYLLANMDGRGVLCLFEPDYVT